MDLGTQVRVNPDTGEVEEVLHNNLNQETTKKQLREEFEALCRPLIKWMNENYHPHVTAIVTPTNCELMEGLMGIPVEDYILD